MKSLLTFLFVLLLFSLTAGSTLAAPDAAAHLPDATAGVSGALELPGPVTSTDDAVEVGKEAIDMAKAGQWFGFSSLIIYILMFALKAFGLFRKIGKRWAYILVPLLGVAAMLLARFQGDLSWTAAWVVLTSAPSIALLNDLFKRGVLGKEPTTPVKPV